MEYRKIGKLDVSAIGLGCNQLGTRCDADESRAIIHRALDLGITLFDTAEEYGNGNSEAVLGAALRGRRQQAVIATKFAGFWQEAYSPGKAGATAITRSVEASLKRLGTDYIDLYQLHFPDPDTPIDETLGALEGLIRSGKVREIGCCNFSAEQIGDAANCAADMKTTPFASAQNRFNLLRQEVAETVLPACAAHGLAFLPYFPLAAGLLTGKYRIGEAPAADTRMGSSYVAPEVAAKVLRPEALGKVEHLRHFAAERGHTVATLAIAWLLANPQVASVIAGATRSEQVAANVQAGALPLDASDAELAGEIGRGAPRQA